MTELPDAPHGLIRVAPHPEQQLTRQQARRLQRLGVVEQIFPGIARVAATQRTPEQRAIAAAWALGAVVSHGTAARFHGLRSWTTFRGIHVTIEVHRRRTLEGVTVHRRVGVDAPDVVEHPSGVLITAVPLTLLDVAFDASDLDLRSAYHDAWHRGLAKPADVVGMLERMAVSGRPGSERLRSMIARYPMDGNPARSLNEIRLFDGVVDAGLAQPRLNHPLVLPSGREVFLDLAWPDLLYAVEVDHSATHGEATWEHDLLRQGELTADGWIVDRFMETQIERQPTTTVRTIAQRLTRLSP